MIIYRKILFFFVFFLIKINTFCSSQYLNYHEQTQVSLDDLFRVYDRIEIINEFLKPKYEKLFIIIAEDMKDGIQLAEYLSKNKRVTPEWNESWSHWKKVIYQEIMECYYLYYSNERYILVYPRNVTDIFLANYLTKRTIELSDNIKVALTCSMNENNFNSLLLYGLSLFRTEIANYYSFLDRKIIFIPLSITSSIGERDMDKLSEHYHNTFARYNSNSDKIYKDIMNLNDKEQLEYLLLGSLMKMEIKYLYYRMNFFTETSPEILKSNYLPTNSNLIKFYNFLTCVSTEDSFRVLNARFNNILKGSYENSTLTDMSNLKGILTYLHWIQKFYSKILSDKSKVGLHIKKFIDNNFCENREDIMFTEMICFIKYMNDDAYNQVLGWMSHYQYFSEDYLKEEEDWLIIRLVKMYKNEISNEYLYKEISKFDGKNQDIMKQVFFTVNNLLNSQLFHLCTQLNDGTYKLQIRGKFLTISQILHKNYCPSKVTLLEVLALNKILINEDVVSHEMKQIIIIAPIWEIYQRRVINLDGAPEYKYMDHLRIEIIRSAVKTSRINGLPGEHGRPGGSFFGVADTIINGENLNISCNGGRGSNGNDGFNGIEFEPYQFISIYPGIGGKGGQGGISGEIQIFLLNNLTTLTVKRSTTNGIDGKSGINGTYVKSRQNRILVEFINLKRKLSSLSWSKIDSNLNLNSQINHQIGINYFSVTVVDYRKYIINNILDNNDDTSFYLNVYRKFNGNANLLKHLTLIDFVKELLDLEYYYSLELNKTIFHFIYMFFNEGIELYKTVTQNIQISTDFKTMFSKLHDMTLKKVSEFHRKSNTEAVLKIAVYLEQSIEDGEKLKNYEIRKKLQTIGNKFKENFEQEIKEAGKLISEDLKGHLDEKIDNLNKQIENLIKEIDEIIDESKKNIKMLNEKKKELENKMILRNLFTIFRFLLLGLSFINPACAIAASVLTKGLPFAEEKLVESNDDVEYNEIQLPKAVTKFVSRSIEYYKEKTKNDLEIVQDKLKAIKESRDKLNLSYDEAKPLIDIDKEVHEQCISKSIQGLNRQKCMIEILEKKEIEWTEKSERNNQKYKRSLQVMKIAEKSLDVVNLGIDRYNKHAKAAAAKDSIDRQIFEQYDEIRKLEMFKENIYKKLGSQIDRIRNNLHKSSDKFAMSSRAVLEYQKFKMDEYLTDASTELSTLTKGFKVEGEVAKIIEKIKKTMSTIINMHTLVKNFKNELNNAEYIKVIAMAPFDITNLNDPQIVEDFTALEEIYYSNRVIDDYNKLTIALKGYAYPLIVEFSEFMTSPNNIFNNSMQKASIIVDKMKSLKLNLMKRIGQGGLSKQVKETKFGNGGSKSAFYKWNSSNYSSAIRDILEGKEVKLFANISQGEHFNALKFRDVDILLTSTDPEINEELKNLLKDYDIYLNHNGDSYYECNKKVHLIKSGSSGTLFKFLSSSRKRRSLYDNNNDYILSPFATWTIRLHRDNGNNDFAPLAKFVDKVNVELIGDGQFIPVDDYICSDYFLNFYKQELQVN
ncbi:uncharacterized protein LOC127280315 [Leptopilina boulardi]|uniref:uncharacterized protein LOC127280315 n=1 Tax=Leptopilina boulardi TaxID=63433 RepID=UPI0021F5EFF9|nr:uncharacterized protein LOC127280315 [Leptopilina boulardi]